MTWGVHIGSATEYFLVPRHQLSDVQIRRAKPTSKARKLFDGGGLFLLLHPNGSRYWRLKYPCPLYPRERTCAVH